MLDRGALGNGYAERLRESFESEHSRRYGFGLEANIEIATLRVVGRGTSRDVGLTAPEGGPADLVVDHHEQVHFDGEWHETAIYERAALASGHTIAGPAIVEQEDTTILIEPGYAGVVDQAGNIIISRQAS